MFFRRILAHQLARPSGLAGMVMGRALDRVNARVNRLALEQLALRPSDRMLDIGFGGGLMLRQALAAVPGVSVAGIEVSQPMIERARREFRTAIAFGRVEIREAGASQIPYASGTFDKIAAINTIHFWPDPLAGLREARRVLRPGGRMVVAVRPKEFLERVHFTELGFTAFEQGELHALLVDAGFDAVAVQRHQDKDMGTVHAVGYLRPMAIFEVAS